jgi:2-polyprenyl-6-methoxyphenol hydroxylase-like FAD-dependent oxidoreductase
VAFMPQWDFLDFLADRAKAYPNFRLMLNAEVTDLAMDSDRVKGVRADTPEGPVTILANLVLGADGRHSIVRSSAHMSVVANSAPMDVLWFRLSRRPHEALPFFQLGAGRVLVCIDRGEYWQMAYVIPSGQFDAVKAAGLDTLRSHVVELYPKLDDRVTDLHTWDDVRFLQVRVDHVRRWYAPGLLCIGDAAHAMSPAGGVGINLAVQDAVAAANILGPALLRGESPPIRELRRVQRRRKFPTRITQAVQVRALRGLYPKNLRDDPSRRTPLAFRLFRFVAPMRYLVGRFIGLGVRPEHIRR